MRRYLWRLSLPLLLLILTGCWDRLEVNDLAIVDIVAIDQAPQGLRLTVSIIDPEHAKAHSSNGGGGDSGGSSALAYSAQGESVMQAMTRIQEQLSRRLFWAHTRVLVISEAYARAGVRPALDFWSRHREPRLMMNIAISPGRAADFVEGKPHLERLLSETVRESINMNLQTKVTVKDFLGWLASETDGAVAPRVALVSQPAGKVPLLSGTAVFRDDRMIGWLNDADTRGLLWLRGESRSGVATIEIPSGGTVSMMLIRGRTKIHPDFRTGRLRLIANVEVEDDIYESSAPIDLGKEETVKVMEQLLARDVEQRMRSALQKAQQEFKVDILGFDDIVHRQAPLRWEGGLKKNWRELFPQVPVVIYVKAHVRRTGEHSSPLGVPERQIKKQPNQLLTPKE